MTEAATEVRREPPCWPYERDWLDGTTEIFLSARHLRAHWDADILDIDDENVNDTIIETKDTFKVRFRVQLDGRLWRCICGHWYFDVCFSAIGPGTNFNLSDVLPEQEKEKLRLCDWEGCKTRCIDVYVTVPPGTIPSGHCGTLYEVGAKFELRCCGECRDCEGHLAVAGHESQGEYMFV